MLTKLRDLFRCEFPGKGIRQSRYNVYHAVIATVVLCGLVFSQGPSAFWRQFVYGLNQTMTPSALLQNLTLSTIFFSVIIGTIWLIARFMPSSLRVEHQEASKDAPNRPRAMLLALVIAPVVATVALSLNWLGATAIEFCTNVKPADQELVKCFLDGKYSLFLRGLLVLTVLFQAPLLEEPIFRGIIFRGLSKSMPIWPAMILSGAFFALVHVNAASFVAVWFLGVVFAWLYHRTHTILAPMALHFLFNGTNVVLLLFFPELAA